MDRETAHRFRRRLKEEEQRYRELLRGIEEKGLDLPLRESVGELSSYDNHPGDLGSEVFERGKDLALADNARLQLAKIGEALRAIEAGKYGTCRRCGREIPPDRLQAAPETVYCLECRRAVEADGDKSSRPSEEGVMSPYPVEKQEYDAEDAWQDVARWNEHAEGAGAGSYLGGSDLEEDRGVVEEVEGIPYFKGADGVFYEDPGQYSDNEEGPREKTVGDEGFDVARRPLP